MSQLTARVIRVAHPEGRVVDVAVNHEGGRASFGRSNGTKADTPRLLPSKDRPSIYLPVAHRHRLLRLIMTKGDHESVQHFRDRAPRSLPEGIAARRSNGVALIYC